MLLWLLINTFVHSLSGIALLGFFDHTEATYSIEVLIITLSVLESSRHKSSKAKHRDKLGDRWYTPQSEYLARWSRMTPYDVTSMFQLLLWCCRC